MAGWSYSPRAGPWSRCRPQPPDELPILAAAIVETHHPGNRIIEQHELVHLARVLVVEGGEGPMLRQPVPWCQIRKTPRSRPSFTPLFRVIVWTALAWSHRGLPSAPLGVGAVQGIVGVGGGRGFCRERGAL